MRGLLSEESHSDGCGCGLLYAVERKLLTPVKLAPLRKLMVGGVTLVNMSIDCLHRFNKGKSICYDRIGLIFLFCCFLTLSVILICYKILVHATKLRLEKYFFLLILNKNRRTDLLLCLFAFIVMLITRRHANAYDDGSYCQFCLCTPQTDRT